MRNQLFPFQMAKGMIDFDTMLNEHEGMVEVCTALAEKVQNESTEAEKVQNESA